MKTKTIILTILISTLLTACSRYWGRIEVNERFVWKKVKIDHAKSNHEIIFDQCKYEKNCALKVFKTEDFKIYEYDSIRVYIGKGDTLLNELIMKGYIQGQYFFTEYESNKCNFINWTNPIKVTENGWMGYHIFLSNLREIEYEKIARKVREKLTLTKAFRFSFYYSGQPFINPSVFKVEIENSSYKLEQQSLDIEKLLDGGKTILFYQSGVEI